MDDLDKFKDDPDAFVKMVGHAVDSFEEKRKERALYKRVYRDERCIITMPKGPEGASAAGSLYKDEQGVVHRPWCVCIKYPENEKWWRRYNAETLFFIYAKDGGIVTNAWCVVLSLDDCMRCMDGELAISQLEGVENRGLGSRKDVQAELLENIARETGLDGEALCGAFRAALQPRREELERKSREIRERMLERRFFDGIRFGRELDVENYLDAGLPLDVFYAGEDDEDPEKGATPLSLAALNNRVEICKLLLDAGADIEAVDRNEEARKPLHSAAYYGGRGDACKLLIDAGADVNAREGNGWTPLLLAAQTGSAQAGAVLIAGGADVDAGDEKGFTPLMQAALSGYEVFCQTLLKAGANTEIMCAWGLTALHYAVERGNEGVCR